MGSEMGPPSRQMVTCYRPIVIIGLPLTVFVVLRLVTDGRTDRQTDGRTDGFGLAKGGTMH